MSRGKILVAEDDTPNREGFANILTWLADYDVSTASNGQQAISRIERDPPDLILLDLMMPVMNGWEFLTERRRHKAWSEIPVIVLTAHADGGGSELHPGDAAAVLTKPVPVDVLLEHIARLIRPSAAPPP
jgi:two-component system chemotaxis response regulator CheY